MEDIVKALEDETKIPTADTAFTKPQKLPFTVVLNTVESDGDDFKHRIVLHNDLAVEFYAERIDRANEKKLEAFFDKQFWNWKRERTWLTDEKCFETIYLINYTERV
ncbi:hypothetical protein HGO97_007670 [Faecalicatena sp. AGMB00832]|uniref:ASCH domain-containing protein n=1 Tax=Faecalicatena faecalis TaxID=2726362 RepID=A0ABS6D2H1_9FIRM|nr:hypothetical protein [Faecalicatena faecalis]MBU3875686.1 hypothetical protein [Faecalicatena faecalis]